MTLTPEQFNKLVTKEEHKTLENKVDSIDKKIDGLVTAVDNFTKEVITSKEERTVNQAAHSRIQDDVNDIRDHLDLKIKNPTLSPEGA